MTKAKRHLRGNDCLHNVVTDISTLDPCQEDICFLKESKTFIKEAWRSNSQTFEQTNFHFQYENSEVDGAPLRFLWNEIFVMTSATTRHLRRH